MSNEADLTRRFLMFCKQDPAWMVWKISDRFQVARPDAQIIGCGRVVLIEFKRLDRAGQNGWKLLRPNQEHMLRKASVASGGRAFVFAFEPGELFKRPTISVWWNERKVATEATWEQARQIVLSALTDSSWFRHLVQTLGYEAT